MKKTVIILCNCFISIFYFSNIFSQTSTWVKQSPLPTGNDISAVWFTDSLTGYISAGTELYKTTDGGDDWIKLNLNVSFFFINTIFFTDSITGYFAGSEGKIFKTTNSGLSFDLKFTGVSSSITSITFLSLDTGFAVSNNGDIIKTSDAGNSWELLYSNTSADFCTVAFPDSQTGYAAGGYNNLIKTTDGGISWNSAYGNLSTNTYVLSLFFLNPNYGYMLTGNKIYKTTNGGTSWNSTALTPANSLNSFFFLNNMTGYAVGYNGIVYKTLSGGNSWSLQSTNTARNLTKLHFKNSNFGIIVGEDGIILKTTNSGNIWENKSSGINTPINKFYFLNSNNGFAACYDGIIKTTNSGEQWVQSYYYMGGIYSVFFTDSITGYGVTYGKVFKTSDASINWSITQIENIPFYDVYFPDSITGFICGFNGRILKTTNAGASWNQVVSGTTNILNCVYFIDSMSGFSGGENNTLLKTTDGGTTWINVCPGTNNSINDIQFINLNLGFAAGYSNLYKTTDGGASWAIISTNTYPQAISIADENNIFFVGGSYYYTSSNGGQSFEKYSVINYTTMNDIYFFNKDTGFIGGNGGYIFKTINGGCQSPDPAEQINGQDSIFCQDGFWYNFNVSDILYADEYIWSYSGIATLVTQNASNLTLSFGLNSTSGLLTVNGLNQCGDGDVSAPFSITVVPSPPTPVISMLSEDTLISSAEEGNQWYNFGNAISGAISQKYLPISEGLYTVRVIGSNGCESNYSNSIYISGILNLETKYALHFNNPAHKILIINSEYNQNCSISLLNCFGAKVNHDNYSNLNNIRINISHLAKGLYFLLIKTNSGEIIKKIKIL